MLVELGCISTTIINFFIISVWSSQDDELLIEHNKGHWMNFVPFKQVISQKKIRRC